MKISSTTITTTTPTPTNAEDFLNKRPCGDLRMGQFKCDQPPIDARKQNEVNCSSLRLVEVPCYPAKKVYCDGRTFDGKTVGFYRNVSCRFVTGYNYETAVLLSIFFGVIGLDRFYLGYIGQGLLKLSTCGFMFIGYLYDLILIISQQLKPIDGSDYAVDYYRQIIKSNGYNNLTFNFTY
jgi:TM2 domain-containing membrane protein YozV